MANRKSTKGQTTSTKHTLRTKNRVAGTTLKPGANSFAPEGHAVPAPQVAPVVLV